MNKYIAFQPRSYPLFKDRKEGRVELVFLPGFIAVFGFITFRKHWEKLYLTWEISNNYWFILM